MTRVPPKLAVATAAVRTVAVCAFVGAVAAVGVPAVAQQQAPPTPPAVADEKEPVRTPGEYNLPKKSTLAIKGYDPVAYFREGGGKAKKGLEKFEYTYKGVTYRFASAEHLSLFKKAPARYEPAHGGWCSWAMREGEKVEVDPKNFIVKDGRLFLFYKGLFSNTRTDWLEGDHETYAAAADAHWKKISGEEKRQVREAPER